MVISELNQLSTLGQQIVRNIGIAKARCIDMDGLHHIELAIHCISQVQNHIRVVQDLIDVGIGIRIVGR